MSNPRVTYQQLEAWTAAARDDIEAAHDAANVLNVEFWDCEYDAEVLRDTCIEDAVESYADGLEAPCDLTVRGYRRAVVPENAWALDPDRLLENLYESLDEEYNSGDDPAEPTAPVVEAAKAFLAVVRREYVPWNCEDVVEVTLTRDEVAAICEWEATG